MVKWTGCPKELVYDWNRLEPRVIAPGPVDLLDETLRDGLQNPSVRDPEVATKLEILLLMARMGMRFANIGIPSSSPRAFADCLFLCREVANNKLGLELVCAARTMPSDVLPIIELSQRSGLGLKVYVFVGSSPIRALAESWDLPQIRRYTAEALDLSVGAGLETTFVTEDTTRSRPEVLAELFKLAIDHGATRLCLCDTVGHATPQGTRSLVRFTKSVITSTGADVGIDWHGHNDRGLALSNALCAVEEGVDRLHGTALGIGERAGNAAMEQLLVNLELLGLLQGYHLEHLVAYCHAEARALGWAIPINYPLVGADAFRTATGVHAAAISKAEAKGDTWLANRVYSGVPAELFGRAQEICVGYMSGASNVVHWLKARGFSPEHGLIQAVLKVAKSSHRILSDAEILAIVRAYSAREVSCDVSS